MIILHFETKEINAGISEKEENCGTEFIVEDDSLIIKAVDIDDNALYLTEISMKDALTLAKLLVAKEIYKF